MRGLPATPPRHPSTTPRRPRPWPACSCRSLYTDDGLRARLAPLMQTTNRLADDISSMWKLLEAANAEFRFLPPHRFPTEQYRCTVERYMCVQWYSYWCTSLRHGFALRTGAMNWGVLGRCE